MTDLTKIYVICNEEVKDSGVSVTKEIHTLIDASKERKKRYNLYFFKVILMK